LVLDQDPSGEQTPHRIGPDMARLEQRPPSVPRLQLVGHDIDGANPRNRVTEHGQDPACLGGDGVEEDHDDITGGDGFTPGGCQCPNPMPEGLQNAALVFGTSLDDLQPEASPTHHLMEERIPQSHEIPVLDGIQERGVESDQTVSLQQGIEARVVGATH
jgi:hypothetical protein